ncbi:hypothetical protein XA68_14064 [Ophiocordyceps unilateralis]|uniref:ubiquitinyl hydrolase 1 n=1 Tax=Ophiocordyceps unilateralis TaxID=268505 RepID=A0A2A9PN70_OPHUN|nr:hypothetical protein XA68_14064 [Ophiocordyceps unilateralis]
MQSAVVAMGFPSHHLATSRDDKETVVFEAFEISPPAHHVLASDNAFAWQFPASAAEIPLSVFEQPLFQDNLSRLLEKAASEPLSRFSAQAFKASVSVGETRESTDPALITHFLMPLLLASGSTVSPQKLCKRVRDDANIDGGEYPWRRSPAWLVMRVAAQRCLQMALGSEIGRASYKFLICVVLADFLKDCAGSLALPLTLMLRAKLCRRLAKLEQDAGQASEAAAATYRGLFESLGPQFQTIIAAASRQIHLAWASWKMETARRIPTLPCRVNDSSLQLSLSLSGAHLRDLLRRHPPGPVAGHKRPLDNCPWENSAIQQSIQLTKRYIHLAELECAAAREDDLNRDITTHHGCCVELGQSIDRLFTALGDVGGLASKPDQASLFVLRVMMLWTEMDKHAMAICPLIRDYHPTFTAGALDVLQLSSPADMRRLRAIQAYLRERLNRCGKGARTIFDEPSAHCFANRYLQSDRDGYRVSSLRERIEKASKNARDEKKEKWLQECRNFDDLSVKIFQETCVCVYNRDGERDVRGCTRCYYARQRKRMRIEVHEDFLPQNQWERQAVVFDLAIPTYLQAYRNATWKIRIKLGQSSQIKRPWRSAPASQLDQVAQLRPFRDVPARGVTMASFTKSFLETHYKFQPMKCEWSSIDLPLGLGFAYYDLESETWIRDYKEPVSFQHLCGIRLSESLMKAGVSSPTDVTWTDGPSSYEVVASITRCPAGMTPQEFMAAQRLLGGQQRRWLTMLTELGASNINLSELQTTQLFGQLAIQAGPDDFDTETTDGLGIVHAVFRDQVFCSRLADLVEGRLGAIAASAREVHAMELLISLALRLYILGVPETRHRARHLISVAREATLRWISHHRDEHRHAADADAARRAALHRLQAALLCRRTFASLIEEQHGAIQADELESFVEASIALQQSLALDPANLPPVVENMLMRDMITAYQMQSVVKESVGKNPLSLSRAICRIWISDDQDQAASRFGPWNTVPGKDRSWIQSVVSGSVEARDWAMEQKIHYHVVEGHLLIDGEPLGKLPLEILHSDDVKGLFGNQHLMTYTSPLSNMTHCLESSVENNVIHFGHRDGRVIIRAIYHDRWKRSVFEFIPAGLFRGDSGFDLPAELIDDCVHWLDIDTGDLEIRRKPKIWARKPGDWVLNVNDSRARRRSSLLVDPSDDICRKVYAIFSNFELPQQISVYQPFVKNLQVRLKRLQLEFSVQPNGLLASSQLQAEIDPDQDAGTLYGLESKIVLRDMADRKRRSLIAGLGPLKYKCLGIHVSAWVRDPNAYTRVGIDSVLGRLTCPPEPALMYYLALFHAVTSFPLSDPLTNSTGTEEAHRILNSGSCQPLVPLSQVCKAVLCQLEGLCPRRTHFPEKMRLLQKVEWSPYLTIEIQRDSYRHIINNIRLISSRLQDFDVQQGERTDDPKEDAAYGLWRRAAIRRGVYERAPLVESQPPSDDVGLPYLGRDSEVKSKWAERVYQTVKILSRRPFKMPKTAPLSNILRGFTGNIIGGFGAPTDRLAGSLDALIHGEIGENWGTLVSICREAVVTGNNYDAVFRLALLSFSKRPDMDAIIVLCAFASVNGLAALQPPPCSHFTGFRDESQDISLERLEAIIMRRCSHLFNDGANSPDSLSQWTRRDRRPVQEDRRLRTEAKALARFILSQWPCATLSSTGFEAQLIDVDEVMEEVQTEWTRVYNNFLLGEYVEKAQILLQHSVTTDKNETRIPWFGGCKWEEKARGPRPSEVIPSLSCELVYHKGPSVQQLSIEELCFPPRVMTAAAQRPGDAQETQELEGILSLFEASPRPLWRQYGNDLRRSCDALRKLGAQDQGNTSVPSLESIDKALKLFDGTLATTVAAITSAMSANDARFQWLQEAALWPCTSTMSLLRLLRSKDKLTFGQGMKELLVSYGVSITSQQRLLRMRNALLKRDEAKLVEQCVNKGHENWDPLEHPDWLLLEIESDLLIRREQVEVANAIISPPSQSNSVLQLNMGRGKTSCIVPMVVAVLANSRDLCRLIVPKALLRQTAQTLQSRIGGLVGREVKHLPFSRRTPTDPEKLKCFNKLHLATLLDSGVILAAPEHILSYKLCGFQRLVDSKLDEAESMTRMQSWLSKKCRDVLDESDFTLAVKTQLVYPSGQLMQVDGYPDRWKVAQGLLWLVKENLGELRSRYGHGIEVVRRRSDFPSIYILHAEVENTLRQRLTETICEGRTEILPLPRSALNERTRDDLRRLLNDEKPDRVVFERLEGTLRVKSSLFNTVLLLRGLLANRILFLCLRKRWNVQYGLHPSRPPLAVPFEAKGVPSEQAEFGHPDVAILFTCLSFYHAGLSLEQFRDGLEQVLKTDDPASEYDEWTAGCGSLPEPLRHWNLLKADDAGQVEELWRHLGSTRRVLDHYMNNFVFPRYAKQFVVKLQSSGWDLPLRAAIKDPKSEESTQARTTGFSGTNDNRRLLPLSIKQEDLPSLSHTSAEVLTYLLKPRNRACMVARLDDGARLSEKMLLRELKNRGIRLLIDAGAYILEMGNRSLIETWLEVDTDANAGVYIDSHENRAWVLYRHSREPMPLLATPFAENMVDCVVYLDEAHTRGTDLKLPPMARGALTLALGQTKDHTVQAAMRLRQLATTQSILFCAPPEVYRSVVDLRRKWHEATIDSLDVVHWLLEQTCLGNDQLQGLFHAQGVDFCRRTSAALRNPKYLTDPQQRTALLKVLQSRERILLKDLYGKTDSHRHETSPDMFHESLRSMATELQALELDASGRDLTMRTSLMEEVEQEREVEFQVEQVREVQKPNHYKGLIFPGLHPTILSFAHTGVLANEDGVLKATVHMARTTPGIKFRLSAPQSRLLVSKEFTRTVGLPQERPRETYMRPVEWVLWSPGSQTAVVLVAEEVELLIPVLRSMASTTPTHLMPYAAPMTRGMVRSSRLGSYSMPPLQEGLPGWLSVELGVLGGRLYFDADEYEALMAHLTVYKVASAAGGGGGDRLAFLAEWLVMMRKGQDIMHTPMGYVCQGRRLEADHAFFH